MASIEAPPPSYDAVVGGSSSGPVPSAPPLSDVHHTPREYGLLRPGEASLLTDHTVDHSPPPQPQNHKTALLKASVGHCLEYCASCSLCGYMHTSVWFPKFQTPDPELDVEAHLGGRGRHSAKSKAEREQGLRCMSGSLCSCWVILVFLFYFLPIAMIITGISSYSRCASQAVILYLIGGGVLYAVLVLLRTINSSLTCCRNRGWLKMTRGSPRSATFIGVVELIFLVLLLINLIVLALGTYYVMGDANRGGPSGCNGDAYRATVFFIVLQYLLYLLGGLFVCLAYGCHKCLTSN